jgi:hypothetical protein
MKVLKQFFWFLMFLVMLAAAAGGGYAVYLERQDREEIDKLRKDVAAFEPRFEKFKGAVGDLSKGFTSLVLEEVDLTRAGWQPIGKGFISSTSRSRRTRTPAPTRTRPRTAAARRRPACACAARSST